MKQKPCKEQSTVGMLPRDSSRIARGVELERGEACVKIDLANHGEVHMSIILDQRPHEQV